MGSFWNIAGVIIWIFLIGYFIYIVKNIRFRRIKMIIETKKTFEWKNFWISFGEVLAFLIILCFMIFTTFFRKTSDVNDANFTRSDSYQPLVIQNSDGHSYVVKESGDKGPVQHYSFLVNGSQYEIPSTNSELVTTLSNAELDGKAYGLSAKKIKGLDAKYQKSWVKIVRMKYKDNLLNGLGMHASHVANQFIFIRVPDRTFVFDQR